MVFEIVNLVIICPKCKSSRWDKEPKTKKKSKKV